MGFCARCRLPNPEERLTCYSCGDWLEHPEQGAEDGESRRGEEQPDAAGAVDSGRRGPVEYTHPRE
jgi:hypothetical protein